MKYLSTRNSKNLLPSMEVIKQGISPEGGLFVPQDLPKLSFDDLSSMQGSSYQQRAVKILSLFLSDFSSDDIELCVKSAYRDDNFSSPKIAPLVKIEDKLYIQELWHGPTSAFKDMALQILPHFMTTAIKNTGEDKEILILTATSGDTGKAALEGFKDVDGTHIIVFYPNNGVSAMQHLQMATQEGGNVKVVAVEGNFDDTQTGVKNIFGNQAVIEILAQKGFQFSSANSINWGRLVPQIVYYVSAYLDLLDKNEVSMGDPFNIVVPTGNFGNILAAYYAKCMGIPINKLICASNDNNVLTEFIKTGRYDRKREFYKTISPSMDILISSNLERLLFEISGRDDKKIISLMNALREKGEYSIEGESLVRLQSNFWGGWASTKETLSTIKNVYNNFGYTMDPHTAVGKWVHELYVKETGDDTLTVLASTASPFKFPGDVIRAITGKSPDKNEWELLDDLKELSNMEIPKPLSNITGKPVLHKDVCKKEDMVKAVLSY